MTKSLYTQQMHYPVFVDVHLWFVFYTVDQWF